MRKALCVGIDCYANVPGLYGCVNDANSVKAALERNGDGTINFDTKIMSATNEETYITRSMLKDAINDLFSSESEIAVLYFAGHGTVEPEGGYLCTSEITRADEGLSLDDVMVAVSNSKAQNNVIILDSCFSGAIGRSTIPEMTNYAILKNGTTLLAGCGPDEYASEENDHGVFTSLLVEALYGGAMTLLGDVTPGSIYAYIDRSLGGWEQRPVFKANIKSFVSLRKNIPPISIFDLQKIIEIFVNKYDEYKLDSTYEHDKHEVEDKTINKEHEEIFSILQKYVKLNLVVPVGEDHMYYAAIHSKGCKLTVQGQHYWELVKNNKI